MDFGGSLLDQACVRVALLPVGSNLTEERFEELASYVTSWREIALNILPRRNAANRSTFVTSPSGNATYSHLPSELRGAGPNSSDNSRFLSRTFSSRSDARGTSAPTLSPTSSRHKSLNTGGTTFSTTEEMAEHFARDRAPSLPLRPRRQSVQRRPRRHSRVPPLNTNNAPLSLETATVDSFLRLRYDVVHRGSSGDYILRTPSNWDSFHSRRVWGVIGICDLTDPELSEDSEARYSLLSEAQTEFADALKHFPSPCVSRVIVFTTSDAAMQQGASVMDSPNVSDRPTETAGSHPELVFGYVPETSTYVETRQEARVQVIHFSELLLNILDRESWRKEKSSNDLFLTPLDEPSTPDKHPKLIKRRVGRLDKLLADNHLLMGSPSEALVKYNSSIEKARANSDRLWLAGAMEGWATAHVLTYVKSGGSVTDYLLTHKLIEHYSEIYKLYSKKRVPELEASAALRLAEFLGKYTPLRKEALEAADHAASVGESLPSVKRASLWEGLAKFSSFMKCHRKAAFFLYRVGGLCAAKSVWSSSEALLTAAAKQFKHRSGKVWPDLHRDILLEAAKSAWELGDPFLATQHYAEALSLSAFTLKRNSDGDASLVKLLMETTTPPYLHAAPQLLNLQRLSALQLPSLMVKKIVTENSSPASDAKNAPTAKSGPFIYDPFKEKALRKAAAAASRAVTWVCGEASHVSMRIQNQTHTELPLEIIAVAIVDAEKHTEMWPALEKVSSVDSEPSADEQSNRQKSTLTNDDDPQMLHAHRVKNLLREVTKTADTMSETVTLPPRHVSRYIEKTISVFPRKTGTMHICGLVVRMFRGTIVLLPTPEPSKEEIAVPPIKVIKALPHLSVSIRQDDGELSSLFTANKPVIIFEGERRRFSVRIKNNGKDGISRPNVKVISTDPDRIEISEVGRGFSQIDAADLSVGSVYDFVIEIAANKILTPDTHLDDDDVPGSLYGTATINVAIEYTGTLNTTMVRESKASVTLALRPAIRISSLSMFRLPIDTNAPALNNADNDQSHFGLVLDVENLVPVPLMIALPPAWRSPNIFSSSLGGNCSSFGMSSPCPTVNVLECGATTRVITAIPTEFFGHVSTGTSKTENGTKAGMIFLSWAMPGVGRNGVVEIARDCIVKAGGPTDSFSDCSDAFNDSHHSRLDLRLKILGSFVPSYSYQHSTADVGENLDSSEPKEAVEIKYGKSMLDLRRYYKCAVFVSNRGSAPFSTGAVLDISVHQNDGRGNSQPVECAALIGSVEGVRIRALEPGATVELPFKVQFTSTGLFELHGVVHQRQNDDFLNGENIGCRWGVTVGVKV